MKVDYYIGKKPETKEQKIVLNGIFNKWHDVIGKQIDSKIISVKGDHNQMKTIVEKLQYWSGAPLVSQRRKDSLLHIISVLVANPTLAVFSQRPLIVTCFDAIPFEKDVSQLTNEFKERHLWAYRKLLVKADRITTLSSHAKYRISEVCQVDPDKIDIVGLAVDHNQFYPRVQESFPEHLYQIGFDSKKKNILYVGSESPRKNLERVIKALPLVKKHVDVRLIKVGMPREPYHSRLQNLVAQLKLEDVVVFSPPLTHDHLPLLYQSSDVFVFPSLYEGFGLPPLEALACGCPVVVSNETSLPEVVGDAAEKIDPYDHISIANGILNVLSNKEYCYDLIERGKIQAKKFTWENVAQDMLSVYQKVY